MDLSFINVQNLEDDEARIPGIKHNIERLEAIKAPTTQDLVNLEHEKHELEVFEWQIRSTKAAILRDRDQKKSYRSKVGR